MKKEIPILFSTPMVRAILDGRKTMTRRIAKQKNGVHCFAPECCKYRVGDLLWVRETFQTWKLGYLYKSTYGEKKNDDWKWKPSIFMPKEAAIIWLEVINVKIERLKDISDGDVAREGVSWNEPFQIKRDKRDCNSPAQRAFRSLWDKINGEESWNQNPFVWVVEFKVLSKTGKPL